MEQNQSPQEQGNGGLFDNNIAPIAIGLYLSHRWNQMTPEEQAANHPFNGFFGKIAMAGYAFLLLFMVCFLLYGSVVAFVVVKQLLIFVFNGFEYEYNGE